MGCRRMFGVRDRAAIMAGLEACLSQSRIAHLIGVALRWRAVRLPVIWAATGRIGPRKLARLSVWLGIALRSTCWIEMRPFAVV